MRVVAAGDQLFLMARDKAYTTALDAPDWTILGTYLVAVLVLIAVTRVASETST